MCRGVLKEIPVRFRQNVAKSEVLVVDGSPVDLIIGYPAMAEVQALLDLVSQSVRRVLKCRTETPTL